MRASYVVAGAAVAAALVYLVVKKKDALVDAAASAGSSLGGAAVDFVSGAVGGAVQQAGTIVGIPKTNETECERAMREGRSWDASFACPAGTFLKYMWN